MTWHRTLLILICLLVSTSSSAEDNPNKPRYVSMKPHFLVNLESSENSRIMQIKGDTLVANAQTETAMQLHMPAIRHEILMKLSQVTPEMITTPKQKEELREELTEIIRTTLRNLDSYDDIKGFYITSMIIQ